MVLVPRDCSCIDTAPSDSFLTMVTRGSDAAVILTLEINVNIHDTRYFKLIFAPQGTLKK